MKNASLIALLFAAVSLFTSKAVAQCANDTAIYVFTHSNKTYELVRINKTWAEAAACAIERGGVLAEINDSTEQAVINSELSQNANIIAANTKAPDGGNGAYVWLGGNDLKTEGTWIWDGDGDSIGTQFWQGTANGSAVNNAYTNWGNEPDNFSNQDALGLSLDGWPLGVAGEWNDVYHDNTLYFLIEITEDQIPGSINAPTQETLLHLYPNPAQHSMRISHEQAITSLTFYNAQGQEIALPHSINQKNATVDVHALEKGTYIIEATFENDLSVIEKFMVR